MEWTICTEPHRKGVALVDNGAVLATVTTPSDGSFDLDSSRGVYQVKAFGLLFPNERTEVAGMMAARKIVRDILLDAARRLEECRSIEGQIANDRERDVDRMDVLLDVGSVADHIDAIKASNPNIEVSSLNDALYDRLRKQDGVRLTGDQYSLLADTVVSHYEPDSEDHRIVAHAIVANLQEQQNRAIRLENMRKGFDAGPVPLPKFYSVTPYFPDLKLMDDLSKASPLLNDSFVAGKPDAGPDGPPPVERKLPKRSRGENARGF